MFDSLRSFVFQLIYLFSHLTASNVIDILLVVFQTLHQTRSLQLLRGVLILAVLGATFLVLLPFDTLGWLVQLLLLAGVIALPLLFQDELRRVLTGLGRFGRRRGYGSDFERFKRTIITAVRRMSTQHIGALIVLEGQTPLGDIISTGILMKADVVTPELLLTVFNPKTPLHDGAVVLSGDRLAAASCILPIQTESTGVTHLGTRHRAALGLSTKYADALVVVVSEESGLVSVVREGQIHRGLSINQLDDWLDRFRDQIAGNVRSNWDWLRGGGVAATLRNLVVAIGLAMIAWVSVVYQTNPPLTHTINGAPLNISGPDSGLIVMSELSEDVDVAVQTTQDRVSSLDASSVWAELSLKNLPSGVHQVPVEVSLADPRAQLLDVMPAFINVTLEPDITIFMTPTVTIMDLETLPLGYVLDEVSLSPELVLISGPQSQVERVAELIVQLSLSASRTSFQKSLIPILLDADEKVVNGLDLDPEQLLATVSIQRNFFTRDIPVQADLVMDSVEPGHEVTRVQVLPSSVTIAGSSNALESAGDFLLTSPISLTNSYSGLTIDSPLILPVGLSALDGLGDNVTSVAVMIDIKPITDYLVLNPLINLRNIPNEINAKLSAARVSALIVGPQPVLAEIRNNPDLIIVYADLTDYSEGEYSISLQVVAPPDVQVTLFPSEVEVVLVSKNN